MTADFISLRRPARRTGRTSLAICASMLLPLFAVSTTGAAERPNIIVLLADDQGWGDVGYNGHPHAQTPTLDAMAAAGLRFDRFYAAAPVCSPTRGSILTGRHPNRFGCFSWGHTLRPEELTVAEVLKDAGYTTGHFGKWHLGPVAADRPNSPGRSGFDEWVSSPNFYENDPLMSHNGQVIETRGESSMVTIEAALPFMTKAARDDKPFLAMIWFGNPHTPHVPTEELSNLYNDLPVAQRNYCAELTGIDRAVGRLREELRRLGIADNTLLWYTSDNGAQGPGSTGGLRGKKASLWEGGIRVPTIIEWPAVLKSPRTTAIPCGSVEIYPTLLELAGVSPPRDQPPLDGIGLASLIHGETELRDRGLGFWVYPAAGRPVRSAEILRRLAKDEPEEANSPPARRGPAPTNPAMFPGHAAWIAGDLKLHRIPADADEPTYRLFDLAKDPHEAHDLAAAQPEQVRELSKALAAWQQSVVRSLNGADYADDAKDSP